MFLCPSVLWAKQLTTCSWFHPEGTHANWKCSVSRSLVAVLFAPASQGSVWVLMRNYYAVQTHELTLMMLYLPFLKVSSQFPKDIIHLKFEISKMGKLVFFCSRKVPCLCILRVWSFNHTDFCKLSDWHTPVHWNDCAYVSLRNLYTIVSLAATKFGNYCVKVMKMAWDA